MRRTVTLLDGKAGLDTNVEAAGKSACATYARYRRILSSCSRSISAAGSNRFEFM